MVVGTLLTVLDPLCGAPVGGRGQTTKLTSLSGNQALTFTSLTWILSRKNGKTEQKFNAQHTEMRLLYRGVRFPLAFPASLGNLR